MAVSELADLGVVHSGRGFRPMAVSHYMAPWWPGHAGLPTPACPCEHQGRRWDAGGPREHYEPWREVAYPYNVDGMGALPRAIETLPQ